MDGYVIYVSLLWQSEMKTIHQLPHNTPPPQQMTFVINKNKEIKHYLYFLKCEIDYSACSWHEASTDLIWAFKIILKRAQHTVT